MRLAPFLVLGLAVTPSVAAPAVDLESVLDRLARVAEVYRDQALQFTCDETVHHHTQNQGRKTHRFSYVYVRDGDGRLQDYRVKRQGRTYDKKKPPRTRAIELTDYGIPSALLRAYSWSFLFDANKRDAYDYELAGEGEALGRPAIKVGFSAVPPFVEGVNEWFGTAWVDAETFLILRVEAMTWEYHRRQRAYERARQMPTDAAAPKHFLIEKISTVFDEERGGMRFPSETILRRAQYRVPGGFGDEGFQRYKVRQIYSNYRFYGVATEEKFSWEATE